MTLFRREPETLDGYTPAFSREETLLGYKVERIRIGGGLGDLDSDPNNPRYEDRHSINVLDHEIVGGTNVSYYGLDEFDIVAKIAKQFLGDNKNRVSHTSVFAYLQLHAKNLTNSARYWKAWKRLQQIEEEKKKIARLQDQITRAMVLASVEAAEVKAQRTFSESERSLLIAEFSGGELKIVDEPGAGRQIVWVEDAPV